MTQPEMSAYLGRPLTSVETTNFKLYLKIARTYMDDLLCTHLCDDSILRVYKPRDGYSTVFIDIFTDVNEVKLNGTAVTTYSPYQWDKRNASWYNSLVFDDKLSSSDEVEVNASWGFASMPSDLQLVLANLFSMISKKNSYEGNVTSKQIEDYRVSFAQGSDLDEEFYNLYNKTLLKYSLCGVSYVLHGDVHEFV